jgi:hypothetical protein
MTDDDPRRGRPRSRAAVALLAAGLLTACAGGEWGGDDPPAPPSGGPVSGSALPPTSRPPQPDPPRPDPPQPGGLVITQNGLPGLQLNRQVLDVSTSDVEDAIGGDPLVLVGQTDRCGLAINEDLGIAAVTDANLAVVGFVVERSDAVTREGIRRGSSTDDIVAAYGRRSVFVRDVPSRSGGRLVWVTDLESPGREPTASSLHYAFDTDAGGRVTRIRAGFWPHVADVDHCSDAASRPRETGWPLG